MNKTVASAAAAAAGALLAVQASLPAHAASGSTFDSAGNPVLFVHGYADASSNWDTMASRFETDGRPSSYLDQWSYAGRQSNATTARQLSTEVDRLLAATGATKVDIVSHSMGGLSSRYHLRNLGGDSEVDAWVSLGGPHHGTDSAHACFDTALTCDRRSIHGRQPARLPGLRRSAKALVPVGRIRGPARQARGRVDAEDLRAVRGSPPVGGGDISRSAGCLRKHARSDGAARRSYLRT